MASDAKVDELSKERLFFGEESIRTKRIDGRTANRPGRQDDPVDDDQLGRRTRWTLDAVRRDHSSNAVEPACISFYFHLIRLPQHDEINSIDGHSRPHLDQQPSVLID